MTSTSTPTVSRVSLQPVVPPVLTPAESTESNVSPRVEPRDPEELKQTRLRRLAIISGGMLAVVAVVAVMASFSGGSRKADDTLVYFTVKPRDLPITVTERGTLQSQSNIQIVCEVDDIPGDGILGTPILWIIENGTSVKKGDLIVELDTSSHLERLDQQVLATEQARARDTQARLYYENRETRNTTNEKNARLDLEIAKLELLQYEDEQGGTFQLELQDVELDIQQREAKQQIDERNLTGTEYLYELGYKSKGDLAQARLQALRAEGARKREEARRRELVVYRYARSKLQLEGAVESAERGLQQVIRNNAALLAQAKARRDSAALSLKREEERLARYREQLEKCKIYAPQSGMVAYHVQSSRWGQSSTIEEGAAVRIRQPILSIPNLDYMQVKTSVHESVVDRVKAGMPATVRLDAFPGRCYEAVVDEVAVLPDPGGWLSSDTKVYRTIVKIEEKVEQLKPGMTAVVEIHIDYVHDALCVPVQAIVQRGDEAWCYIAKNGRVQKCPIELGKTNDKFVEICAGIAEGDQIVLNPSAILADNPEQDRDIAPDKENVDDVSLD